MTPACLLKIDHLSLVIKQSQKTLVDSVSFSLAPGEQLGLVGESGSGKSILMRAVMDLLPPAIGRQSGEITFDGKLVSQMTVKQLQKIRGKGIGLVFQEPMTSLNPALRIGRQLEEGLILHTDLSAEERRHAILSMLYRVDISNPKAALNAYPHEFSGGMRQRIMLASVMLLEPALLIADEPTTALDAVVQRDVLELLHNLVREKNTALVLISHDMSLVAQYTNRMLVMKEGQIVERGKTQGLLSNPQQSYTRKLLSALPQRSPARTLQTASPIARLKNVTLSFGKGANRKQILHGIDLAIRPREIVALVGGSGSGKTTAGRLLAGLLPPDSGQVLFREQPLTKSGGAYRDYRANCQMVFQDPYSSLNPRLTIGSTVAEPLRHEKQMSKQERSHRVENLLVEVGLSSEFLSRYPHELSGGQRQRVAIARALVRNPDFVIADEAVSALDMTVRAQVLDLLARLQKERGFACLFISHDLGVVEQVADRVVVINQGRIEEEGSRDDLFDRPRSPYTRQLLSAVPVLEPLATGGIDLKWRFDTPDSALLASTSQ